MWKYEIIAGMKTIINMNSFKKIKYKFTKYYVMNLYAVKI